MSFLTTENYSKGFLIDHECIGGITLSDRHYHVYAANYLTSETEFSHKFDSLQSALDFINKVPREWIYESIGCSKVSAKLSCGTAACGC